MRADETVRGCVPTIIINNVVVPEPLPATDLKRNWRPLRSAEVLSYWVITRKRTRDLQHPC